MKETHTFWRIEGFCMFLFASHEALFPKLSNLLGSNKGAAGEKKDRSYISKEFCSWMVLMAAMHFSHWFCSVMVFKCTLNVMLIPMETRILKDLIRMCTTKRNTSLQLQSNLQNTSITWDFNIKYLRIGKFLDVAFLKCSSRKLSWVNRRRIKGVAKFHFNPHESSTGCHGRVTGLLVVCSKPSRFDSR